MIYAFDEFIVDTEAFELRRGGDVVPAEPQVLDLLILLLDNHDRVLTREELFARIWAGRVVSDTTLSSRIKTLRQLLGDDGSRQKFIRTVHGRGFRFVGEPEIRADDQAASTNMAVHADAPVSDFARPQTQYARSGGVHVAYQVFGAGPANLVLVPGFVSHIDNYWDNPRVARWLQDLAGFARVAMFDKRGTGLSDQVPHLPGMDERMDDVRAVMDAAGFERAAIMGISEGGSLAALFAASHPQRCDALILYGAFARFESWFPDEKSLQGLFDYIETGWGSGASLPNFAPSMGGDPEFTRWWGRFERLGATPGAAIALMRMNSRIDLTHVLPSISVPTLVIHRADDVTIDIEGGLTLAEKIPDTRFVELSGQDHIPWVGDNALEIPRAVREFLAEKPAGDPVDRVLATIVVITLGEASPSVAAKTGIGRRLGSPIARYRGSGLVHSGDRFIVTFDGPARALHCAKAIVSSLRGTFDSLRLGVHTGEVEIGQDSVEGLAVQTAGSIADAANPHEVLVSRTVNDLVAGSGVFLVDAGARRVDGVPEDWQLYLVADQAEEGHRSAP